MDTAPDFDPAVATARRAFAQLLGIPADRVASGASVSGLVGLVASALPDGARVLVPRREFTSVTYPFAVQAHRGITLGEADVAELPDRAAGFDVVAASVVQSSDGTVLDLPALREAAQDGGTRVLLDVSQALGWLPLAGGTAGSHRVDWADWVVGASYKWLLSPRGAAWLAVRSGSPELVPHSANWYAAEDPWSSVYGLPAELAPDARAFDFSPVWFAQVGAAAALSWLTSVDSGAVAEHCIGLADEFRSGLGLPPGGLGDRLGGRFVPGAGRRGSAGQHASGPGAAVVPPLQHPTGRRQGVAGTAERVTSDSASPRLSCSAPRGQPLR